MGKYPRSVVIGICEASGALTAALSVPGADVGSVFAELAIGAVVCLVDDGGTTFAWVVVVALPDRFSRKQRAPLKSTS